MILAFPYKDSGYIYDGLNFIYGYATPAVGTSLTSIENLIIKSTTPIRQMVSSTDIRDFLHTTPVRLIKRIFP